MSEKMARALGAGGSTIVMIAGKECMPRPLGIMELSEVERDCLERYKRSYLKTFSDNADLIPENEGIKLLRGKMEEVATWDVGDLPAKYAHDPDKLSITKGLRKWLQSEMLVDKDASSKQLKRVCATALDREMLSAKLYERKTKEKPAKMKVPYVNWWITGSFDGMISLVWTCFKGNGVTREQVAELMVKDPAMLAGLSREIEHLSAPEVKNG
ncbi:hypothetical protein LCGC14_0249410 [marine sediment metagenome]|uniref:Uncharacterized protein n=1 Tax=marine sediment metagenome TaxID=412755 RepID=A0A0F9X9U0_9ZZZZ